MNCSITIEGKEMRAKMYVRKLHVYKSLCGNFTTREIYKFKYLVDGVFPLNMG